MTTPTGRPRGRPPGSLNKANARLKELCQKYTEPIVEELAKMAGLVMEPMRDSKGDIITEPLFNADGSPMLDADGRQLFRAKMRKAPGATSELARLNAMGMLWERGHGKATQPISGDDDAPPVAISKIEIEEVPVGTAINSNEPAPESDDPEAGTEEEKKVA